MKSRIVRGLGLAALVPLVIAMLLAVLVGSTLGPASPAMAEPARQAAILALPKMRDGAVFINGEVDRDEKKAMEVTLSFWPPQPWRRDVAKAYIGWYEEEATLVAWNGKSYIQVSEPSLYVGLSVPDTDLIPEWGGDDFDVVVDNPRLPELTNRAIFTGRLSSAAQGSPVEALWFYDLRGQSRNLAICRWGWTIGARAVEGYEIECSIPLGRMRLDRNSQFDLALWVRDTDWGTINNQPAWIPKGWYHWPTNTKTLQRVRPAQ